MEDPPGCMCEETEIVCIIVIVYMYGSMHTTHMSDADTLNLYITLAVGKEWVQVISH
jgi:hypothetical protein